MPTYYGFSTVSSSSQKKFVLTDRDLIKQDLLNILMTRRGSALMQPNFGCIVWEKIFENITTQDVQDIASNISTIIANDPRVNLLSIDVTPSGNNITVTLKLQYASTNFVDQLVINFNNNNLPENTF